MSSNERASYGRTAASQGFTHLPLGTESLPPSVGPLLPFPSPSRCFFAFLLLTPLHQYKVAPGRKPTTPVEISHTGKSRVSTLYSQWTAFCIFWDKGCTQRHSWHPKIRIWPSFKLCVKLETQPSLCLQINIQKRRHKDGQIAAFLLSSC